MVMPEIKRRSFGGSKRRDKDSRQRGSALLIALVAVLVVAVAVLLAASWVQHRIDGFLMEERSITLTALADSAVASTLANLKRNKHFSGLYQISSNGGTYTSTVFSSSRTRRLVIATARYRGWTMRIEAEVDVRHRDPRVLRWRRVRRPG